MCESHKYLREKNKNKNKKHPVFDVARMIRKMYKLFESCRKDLPAAVVFCLSKKIVGKGKEADFDLGRQNQVKKTQVGLKLKAQIIK